MRNGIGKATGLPPASLIPKSNSREIKIETQIENLQVLQQSVQKAATLITELAETLEEINNIELKLDIRRKRGEE